jgi:hypothetical protein
MAGERVLLAKPTQSTRSTRRRHDASRFVRRFKELTGYEVTSDNVLSLPREFLARTVPSPEELLRSYGPELALRTRNALCRFDPGVRSEPWTFARLLQTRGLGVLSLVDLLEVLSRHGIYRRDH